MAELKTQQIWRRSQAIEEYGLMSKLFSMAALPSLKEKYKVAAVKFEEAAAAHRCMPATWIFVVYTSGA